MTLVNGLPALNHVEMGTSHVQDQSRYMLSMEGTLVLDPQLKLSLVILTLVQVGMNDYFFH